ncbi:MAG: hypothetical protein KJ023_21030 [Burkholderiaceae bacterium]|nr:hypothetical protein [Burkholderiaceae bacterium]
MTSLFRPSRAAHPIRRGAASLVVVMVLFFIITLVAAYMSRNLLFEQRTSTNQFRSTLAFETAEAGVEWALARLNDARMNDDCTPLTSAASVTTEVTFRERYLDINSTTGVISPVAGGRIAGCIFDGVNWVCDCPATGNPNPAVTYTGNGPFAAFWVRFLDVTPVAAGVTGIVRMQVNACTRADANCLDFATRAPESGDGMATVWALIALRSALPTLPAAALSVSGTSFTSDPAATPTISNSDPISGGITVHSAAPVPAGLNLVSVPGSPPELSTRPSDATLHLGDLSITPATPANLGTNRMFNAVFGTWPATYFAQPARSEIDCSGGCTHANINDAARLRPGQPIWVKGSAGLLDIGGNIGSTTDPVLILAEGDVEFSGGTPTVVGAIYTREAAAWTLEGAGTIQGAAMAERDFSFAAGSPSITYDRDVLLNLRHRTGSFVKVPGGWRDFQP